VADAAMALFLVKLRILHKFDKGKPLPQITYAFMRNGLHCQEPRRSVRDEHRAALCRVVRS
jgi:hypothetical protein